MKYPSEVYLLPTNQCNLHCFFCMRDYLPSLVGDKRRLMSLENLTKLESCLRQASIVDISGFGETFLHPDYENLLNYILATNQNGDVIQIITNGTLLSDKHYQLLRGRLANLIISLNSASPDTYRLLMGSNFKKTLDSISKFIFSMEDSDRSKVTLAFVASKGNYFEMADFVRLASQLGVQNVSINQFMVNAPANLDQSLLYIKREYNEAADEAIAASSKFGVTLSIQKFLFPHRISLPRNVVSKTKKLNREKNCSWPDNKLLIWVDGTTWPCCFSRIEDVMGNVFEDDFESVWFGPKYDKLRKKRYLPSCNECTALRVFDDPLVHVHPQYQGARHKLFK